jgi:hypothetical protein
MQFILLFIFLAVGCEREDRVKDFIKSSVLSEDMKMYEINSYKLIPLESTCEGRRLFILPAQDLVMPYEAEVGVNLCGSAGCVMYLIADNGKDLEILHEANYYSFVKESKGKDCADLTFESYMGKDGETAVVYNKELKTYVSSGLKAE